MKTIKSLLTFAVVASFAFLSLESLSNSSKDSKKDTVVLSSDNVIVLSGEINGTSVGKVLLKAKELDSSSGVSSKLGLKSKKPIYLFLSTPGGGIQAGLEMLQGLQGIGRPINTITSFAASMGFQVVQGLGQRLVLQNGVLMSHRASGGMEGEFGGQSPSQLDSRYHFWLSRLNEMDEQTVKRTNGKQTLASYQKEYASEMWLTGSQAVKEGYADKLVSVRCDSSLDGVTSSHINFMGMDVSYDLDNCPLNSAPMNVHANIVTRDGRKVTLEQFLKEGGAFGTACYQLATVNKTQVCALDTTLTLERIQSVVEQFSLQGIDNKSHVLPMKW